jgi:hypothetical protein
MKVFNLACDQGHRFEGWFGSGEEYERQQREALLSCPVCASAQVERLPSAPYIGKARPATDAPAAPAPAARQPVANLGAQALAKLMDHIVRNTEDVGGRFPEEARKIHYGESDERRIRGTASTEEVESLHEEGIDVLALPGHLAARRH